MHYYELYSLLKSNFPDSAAHSVIPELGIDIKRYIFESQKAALCLSGSQQLQCNTHELGFEEDCSTKKDRNSDIWLSDFGIRCNQSFPYYIIKKSASESAKGFILFFHGLNEKRWDKYLPWAYELARQTGKAVILFPIAFHMDRAPEEWSNKQQMLQLAKKRTEKYPENSTSSSFINAALSSRLEHFPQRLFWSGLQTYADVVQLIQSIRQNQIPEIEPGATVDLFGYSIGSFFASILKMANPSGYFKQAKLFCFCGGMTIDRMFPVSKYIMDASAAIAMQRCYAELLSSDFATDKRLAHFQNWEHHPEEAWFKTMLRYNYFLKEREALLGEMSHQIKALVLKQDEVAPPVEALNTLKGGYRDIPIEVVIDDYPYPYSHMNPFSLVHKYKADVDVAFGRFGNLLSEFFK
ncbi:MAG: hypothetical protein EOP54_15125 [Sphingobacteriales bacterium]|nr:MAG: hypothetical protein EOP54_15125 [Sphingobacteriales bacterium]